MRLALLSPPYTHKEYRRRAKAEVEGLSSGKQYWFQVCAVGTAGLGPWSDPATKVVP